MWKHEDTGESAPCSPCPSAGGYIALAGRPPAFVIMGRPRLLAVSLGLTAVILLFQLAVALPAAYGLARWRGRLRDAAYLLYCLLTLLPVQVMLLPNYLVCRALGPLNTQLAIVLLGVFSPLSVFLLARAMQRIGVEQSEAASLDGAGAWCCCQMKASCHCPSS